jgi:glycosyltransferase involved in cell wall biosynthesis
MEVALSTVFFERLRAPGSECAGSTVSETVPQSRPLISVVIPTHNRPESLVRAVRSVLDLPRHDFDLEVIVIDDDSTDDTREAVQALPVRFRHISARSAAAARNEGMRLATGDFVAFLDDDDVWLPNNLEPQLKMLLAHPEYGAVHAQALICDEDTRVVDGPMPGGPLSSGSIFSDLLTYWPQIGTFLVRASVVREIGEMDPALYSEEEWDWVLRIAERYPIGRVAEPVMLYTRRMLADQVRWARLDYTIEVFQRRIRHLGRLRRLVLQRVIWQHRGWYCSQFLDDARQYKADGNRATALKCIYYALRASPLHAIAGCRSLRQPVRQIPTQ